MIDRKQKLLYAIRPIFPVIFLLIFGLCFSGISSASERIIKKDIDNDGKVDQVAHVDDNGNITQLELYNSENHLIAVQYYENGHLVKTEKDTDNDQVFDITDYFNNGKRVRQEKISPEGIKRYVITFDNNEKVSEIKKDSNKDGVFDQVFFYTAGVLTSATVDKTNDGKVNVWKTYKDGRVVCQKIDDDESGVPEEEIFFDPDGRPEKSCHDLDEDGYMETLRQYSQGKLIIEKQDLNHDNAFDITKEYKNNQEMLEARDTDFDGRGDVKIWFKGGRQVQYQKDTDKDGVMDRTVFFDLDGDCEKVVLDTNDDGKSDQWLYYQGDALERFETDRNHDGKADLEVFYKKGEKQLLKKDDDFNSFFEITQHFDQKGWTVVVACDTDEDDRSDCTYFYTGDDLMREDIDENGDGSVDYREFYDANGRKIKSQESVDNAHRLNMTWYYDQSQAPVKAEKDTDADGRTDIWYFYNDNHMTAVREDTNHDGQPDVWEEYDADGHMTRRSRDLNFDGVPDMKEDFSAAAAAADTVAGKKENTK